MSLSDLRFPLKWQQKLTISRNIEKMLGEALGDPSEVSYLFSSFWLKLYGFVIFNSA